jgi:hypothetical protein
MRKLFVLCVAVISLQLAEAQKQDHPIKGDPFFSLKLQVGEKVGNIFSRTISFKGDSFPEVALRVSGTALYTVTDNSATRPMFSEIGRYDGRPEHHADSIIIADGGRNITYNGKASLSTDGSGILYNSFIWGAPPATLKVGDSWTVNLPQPWELGGTGTQTITVMEIDATNNAIWLKREGSGEGYFDNDYKQVDITKDGKKIKMNVTPGASHWVGYTCFKNGLTVSDELLVDRPVTLTTDSLQYTAMQREYILLNEMPAQ